MISIITVTYNSEKTLTNTIESILKQKNENVEYIIIDGNSTDRTIEIIKKYENKGINRWISEDDEGISDAFNKGIRIAKGDIIGLISSDDVLLPGAIESIESLRHEETDVIYGDAVFINEYGEEKRYSPKSLKELKKYMSLYHPSVFIRKDAYKKYGLYSKQLKCCMDRDLLLRMYTQGARFQYIKNPLVKIATGGMSDKTYLNITIPEGIKISVNYGTPYFIAKKDAYLKMFKYRLRQLYKKTRSSWRKIRN